ncbi:galactose-binding domain-containing protein [Streptomyces sp. NPDC055036]
MPRSHTARAHTAHSRGRREWTGPLVGLSAGVLLVAGLLAPEAAVASPAAPPLGDARAQTQAGAQASHVLHAAPRGKGTDCSASRPCAVEAAQKRVRALNDDLKGDVVVQLTDGTYRLDEPLDLTAADSGGNGHQVVWQPAPGAHPVLSGGRPITGWRKTDTARGTWTAKVPASLRTRQLYVDGKRIPVAQGPAPATLTRSAGGYTAADDRYAKWRNPSDIEFVFTGGNGDWTESRCRVKDIRGTRLTMRQPCWDNVTDRPKPAAQAPYYFPDLAPDAKPTRIENAYELLRTGQWYLDTARHTVSYIPPDGTDPNRATIEAPVLQTLISGHGTLDQPVHDIVLRGLTFAYATWLDPSGDNGFAEIQANVRITGDQKVKPQGTCTFTVPAGTCPFGANAQEPAAVTWRAARDVVIEDNAFTHLGAAGLGVAFGSHRTLVQGNEFTDISGIGLMLGSTDDPHPSDVGETDREINTDNRIENNYIHHIGVEYPGADGIQLFYSRGTTVAHNEIANVPWDGIDSGVNAGHLNTADHPDLTSNINADNTIANNLVHDYHSVLADGGAIYLEGHQGQTRRKADGSVDEEASFEHGTKVTGNVVYNDLHSGLTLYNDIGSQWITWTRNVEFNNTYGNGGCAPVGHIRFTGNYHADLIAQYPCAPAAVDLQYADNTQLPMRPGPGDLPADILGNAGLQPAYQHLAAGDAPTISSMSPRTGTVDRPTETLIVGTGFSTGSKVFFGPTPAVTTTVLSSTFLSAVAPAGASLAEATVETGAGRVSGPSGLPLRSVTADSLDDEALYNVSFYPYNVVDGKLNTFWSSARTAMPHWIEVRFDHPVTLGKVVVRGQRHEDMTLKDISLTTANGSNAPTPAGRVTDNTAPDVPFTFTTPVTTDTVRVTAEAETFHGEPRANADIGQIEFYDADGNPLSGGPVTD